MLSHDEIGVEKTESQILPDLYVVEAEMPDELNLGELKALFSAFAESYPDNTSCDLCYPHNFAALYDACRTIPALIERVREAEVRSYNAAVANMDAHARIRDLEAATDVIRVVLAEFAAGHIDYAITALDKIRNALLPVRASLRGSDPAFTGDLSTEEAVRETRREGKA